MIRPIMRDQFFLSQKSSPATQADLPTAADLLDTLKANADRCVGMAANMIGVSRCIIVFRHGDEYRTMLNPKITARMQPFQTEEGCLSLSGVRPCLRYRTIRVRYQDCSFREQEDVYTGWSAQIIQHEIDHCSGIII